MELSLQLTCPCRPAFTYKNEVSLAGHKKTKLHRAWEDSREHKQDRARAKEFENEIERLKRRIIHKEEVERALLKRIQQLENEIYVN